MTTAAQVAAHLGPALLLGTAGQLAVTVDAVVLTDPVHPVPLPPGALVIAVGFPDDGLAVLMADAAAAGVGALLVKGTPVVPDPPQVALLRVDPAADWSHVASLARTALSTGAALGAAADDSLFALADALAALCGGPVVIHDAGWQLLAYSGGEAADPTRAQTLLGRRAPAETLAGLRAAGYLDRLLAGELLHVPAGTVAALPAERYAAAVVVGGELLATLWVAPAAGLPEREALTGLRRAVEVAALALLRHAAVARPRAEKGDAALEALLTGSRTERIVAERLRVPDGGSFVLAGLRPVAADATEGLATARRLVSIARSYADAYRVRVGMAAVEGTVFLLLPLADRGGRAEAQRVVADLHGRLQTTAPNRAVVSAGYDGLGSTAAVRADVDELLDLAERRGWSGLVDAEDVRASWRLEQFREVALAHPALLQGPVLRLVEHDQSCGSELVSTLRVWFESVGDARETAKRMGLHHNTVRYRLRRAEAVARLDLTDPDQRLLAELQVRLLRG